MALTFGNSGDNGTQGTTSFSFNNNGDFLLVIAQGTTAPTGATYNSVAMTQIGTNITHVAFGRTVNLWGLVAPAQGANTLAASGSANADIGALSISGVDQTTPTSGFADVYDTASTTPSLSVTTTVDNAYVVGCFFGNWSSIGANNTVVRQIVEAAFQLIRSTNAVTPAGAFTMNSNATAVNNVLMGVGVNPAATVTTLNTRRTLLGVGI